MPPRRGRGDQLVRARGRSRRLSQLLAVQRAGSESCPEERRSAGRLYLLGVTAWRSPCASGGDDGGRAGVGRCEALACWRGGGGRAGGGGFGRTGRERWARASGSGGGPGPTHPPTQPGPEQSRAQPAQHQQASLCPNARPHDQPRPPLQQATQSASISFLSKQDSLRPNDLAVLIKHFGPSSPSGGPPSLVSSAEHQFNSGAQQLGSIHASFGT